MNCIICNGWIVNTKSIEKADIEVKQGKISSVGIDLLNNEQLQEIDATNHYILPGVIDVHTHINHFGGKQKTNDDFYRGSLSAAYGGTTAFIDFAIQNEQDSIQTAIDRRLKEMKGQACIDYSIHGHLKAFSKEAIKQIDTALANGISTFKIFTTYRDAGFMIDDYDCLQYMEALTQRNCLLMVHAENDSICQDLTNQFVKSNTANVENYPKSRPAISEEEAISKLILFSKRTGMTIYFVHVSTKEGLALIEQAIKDGISIIAETCTHYLSLTEDLYNQEDGYKYIMSPPLRTNSDINALWKGVKSQSISIISSDHCAYNAEAKLLGKSNFTEVSPGLQGIEMLLPVIYTLGFEQQRITLNELVAVLCENPAKVFGLQSKGKIEVDYDADLLIINPTKETMFTDSNHHMQTDYNPYHGWKLKGVPDLVMCRGKIIIQNGVSNATRGFGHLQKRFLM